jgi:hypothetical protein
MATERRIAANGAKSRGPVTPEGKAESAANSAHSTGPRTPEGKAASARNPVSHRDLTESIVIDTESVELFARILADHEAGLQPADTVEHRFIEIMAIAEWNRRRLLTIGTQQLAMEMERQQQAVLERFAAPPDPAAEQPSAGDSSAVEINPARTLALAFSALTDGSRTPEVLSLQENRCDRQYMRALKGLRQHRAEKRKVERDLRDAHTRRNARMRRVRVRGK